MFEWKKPIEPWKRWGVIVTADCDIAWQKHKGILSYVPITTIDTFIDIHWLPEQFERILKHQVAPALAKLRQALDPQGESQLSSEALIDWIGRDGVDAVIRDAQAGTDSALRDQLSTCATIISASKQAGFHDRMSSYLRVTSNLRKQPQVEVDSAEWSKVDNFVKRLPGDCFFLSCLSPQDTDGYVVYLRGIRELPIEEFPTSTFDLGKAAVIRFARLTSPYKYRITQLLASMFADIGLPASHSDASGSAIETLKTRLRKSTS